MPAFHLSFRISGDDVRGSELVRQLYPHINAVLEQMRSQPGIEVECFMSQELGSPEAAEVSPTPGDGVETKPSIRVHPVIALDEVFDGRVTSSLNRFGFTTLNQLAWMSGDELGMIPGIGAGSLDRIMAALEAHGLQLLPRGMSLKQRDWRYLPLRSVSLFREIPEDLRPGYLPAKLALGRFVSFDEQELVSAMNDCSTLRRYTPDSLEVKGLRDLAEAIRLIIG